MKKKVYIITGSKGGCGKSLLTWIMTEKHREASILDLDDATGTTMEQTAHRNPTKVSFLDKNTKRIDRGAFNALFESIASAKKCLFIADAGSSVAEQLPMYFSMNGVENIMEVLELSEIELHVVCVVGGGNIFSATMRYLVQLVESCKGLVNITIANNGFYPMLDEQLQSLEEFATSNNLTIANFDLAKDKGEMAMKTVQNVLRSGKGINGLSPFQALYFKRAIEELPL
jgi:hypothetical protein